MQFSDTTNKSGVIQTIERWTGLGDAAISGDTTLLRKITSSVNDAFDTLLPLVLSFSDHLRWDDINHSDLPIGTFDIVSGQGDYSIVADANGLDILNITAVRLKSSSSSYLADLEKITIDEVLGENAMNPNSSETGVPTKYLEFGNTIFLYPKPNFSLTSGGQIFFEREPSYFAYTDTTKEPGIPKPFHSLLALYASLDWILIYKNDNTALIISLKEKILKKENELKDMISRRTRTVSRMVPRVESTR